MNYPRESKKRREKSDFVALAQKLEAKLDEAGLSDVDPYKIMDDISQDRIHNIGNILAEWLQRHGRIAESRPGGEGKMDGH
jgi:hypothetical protein